MRHKATGTTSLKRAQFAEAQAERAENRTGRNIWLKVAAESPHILRHTCATWLVIAGISYEEIGKMLGDTAETIERIYGHHHPDFLKKASKALDLTAARIRVRRCGCSAISGWKERSNELSDS